MGQLPYRKQHFKIQDLGSGFSRLNFLYLTCIYIAASQVYTFRQGQRARLVDMSRSESIEPFFEALDSEMTLLESSISHLTKDGLAAFIADLPPMDKAKACMTLLYALNSSIFCMRVVIRLHFFYHRLTDY